MPQLDDILVKRKGKKFTKKSYRPWDLSGNDNAAPVSDEPIATEAPSPQKPAKKLTSEAPPRPAVKAEPKPSAKQLNQTQPLSSHASTQEPPVSQPTLDNRLDNENKPIPTNTAKKPAPIAPNLGNVLDNKKATASENTQGTHGEHLDNVSITHREQLDNNQITIREQLDNDLSAGSLKNRLAKLSGLQRQIIDCVLDICLAREATNTGPIETSLLSQYINANYGTTKTSLNRLVNKGFLNRLPGRTAKGGYINLELPDHIRDMMIQIRQSQDQGQNKLHVLAAIREQLDNNPAYYSSSNITTTTNNNQSLPKSWQQIDIEPLNDIGFSKTQLKQLVDRNDSDVVQESIHHFAYALTHNDKYKNHPNPLNVIMGVLRKGQGWFERNYESPQDKAMREMLEAKKARKQKQDAMLNELVELELPGWRQNLTEAELQKIVPADVLKVNIKPAIDSTLRAYFIEHVLKPKLNLDKA
jgi:predicted transcriptional regulator